MKTKTTVVNTGADPSLGITEEDAAVLADAAEAEDNPHRVRRDQIIAAIVQSSKKKGLNPLALVTCGADGGYPVESCKDPVTALRINYTPESEILNLDYITNAFCAKHWRRGRSEGKFCLHWHEISFLHPKISVVCIEQKAKWRSWTRNPEKFGTPVRTAKDSLGNTIRPGAMVVYHRPVGQPSMRTGSTQTEAKVTAIFNVQGTRVLRVQRIIPYEPGLLFPKAKPSLRLSPRLSTKHAAKTVTLPIPKKFRRVMS